MKYLGLLLLVLSGYVMAEEVYYCSNNTNGSNGFKKIDGQYKRVNFTPQKFKMKLQDDGNIAVAIPELGRPELYICSTPYGGALPKHKNNKSCVNEDSDGYYFNFNQDNGRYVWVEGSGYVFGDNDTVSIHIGTCTKF
jgi:hypothetical protein